VVSFEEWVVTYGYRKWEEVLHLVVRLGKVYVIVAYDDCKLAYVRVEIGVLMRPMEGI